MQLLLSRDILEQFEKALRTGGSREIGGLLFGEHIGGETFRVVEISVQLKGGTFGDFMRDPLVHQQQLQSFFERTGEDHIRFNYLGEWHSHPSFPPVPSSKDVATMTSLLTDPKVGVNFLVLLILRRRAMWGLEMSATSFRAAHDPAPVRVFTEMKTLPSSPQRRRRAI
jgi:[CysO sulfur-carrier protein]-S-L-cysteine hydrolase